MTPAVVHFGHAEQLHTARAHVLEAAYTAHPERFVRKPPVPPELPTPAWINKPDTKEVAHYSPAKRLTGLDRLGPRAQCAATSCS